MFFCPTCKFVLDISKSLISKSEKIDIAIVITKITNNEAVSVNLNDKIIADIKNSLEYKELSKEHSDKVLNYIKNNKNAIFLCSNCGYNCPIEKGKVIFEETKQETENILSISNELLTQDDTLPRTRDFICPNKKCKSKDKKGEAIIYKKPGLNNVVYICCTCSTAW